MPTAEIVLTTFNAKYAHTSFGLRYLMANLGILAQRATIIEFSINDSVLAALDEVLAADPKLVGLGVYIWNIEPSTQFVMMLKRLRPEIVVVIGGPEVSYDFDELPIFEQADYLITGEADLAFAELCRKILLENLRPIEKMVAAMVPSLSDIKLPYDLYSDEDLRRRTIYVEASRGCPFTCEFCLSSLEIPVRQFDVDAFLQAMQVFLDRGARQFKFIDRTFNLNLRVSQRILNFFLERYQPGLFLHFEMIPDRLPQSLRESIRQFPAGSLQFEVGIQTFNDDVARYISRRQDNEKLADNFHFLREQTGVHIHADLIVGLPGESLESFGAGFDRLISLRPQEIQVGILKRLRGTPIIRHDTAWRMVYSPTAPYEILENRLIDFRTMQRLRRFARFWDLVGNSGNFADSVELIWGDNSPFQSILAFCDRLYARDGQTHGIALTKLVESVFDYLVSQRRIPPEQAAEVLYRDYLRGGRKDKPVCLLPYLSKAEEKVGERDEPGLPQRQRRHLRSNAKATKEKSSVDDAVVHRVFNEIAVEDS